MPETTRKIERCDCLNPACDICFPPKTDAFLQGRLAEAAWWSARAEEAGVLEEWTLGPDSRISSLIKSNR